MLRWREEESKSAANCYRTDTAAMQEGNGGDLLFLWRRGMICQCNPCLTYLPLRLGFNALARIAAFIAALRAGKISRQANTSRIRSRVVARSSRLARHSSVKDACCACANPPQCRCWTVRCATSTNAPCGRFHGLSPVIRPVQAVRRIWMYGVSYASIRQRRRLQLCCRIAGKNTCCIVASSAGRKTT